MTPRRWLESILISESIEKDTTHLSTVSFASSMARAILITLDEQATMLKRQGETITQLQQQHTDMGLRAMDAELRHDHIAFKFSKYYQDTKTYTEMGKALEWWFTMPTPDGKRPVELERGLRPDLAIHRAYLQFQRTHP